MTRLQYPALIAGVWRWAETNITSSREMHAVGPCLHGMCNGHRTALSATLHHASHFCADTLITTKLVLDEKKQCLVCFSWTRHRAQFTGCPYDDWLAVCSHCNARPSLRNNHYLRRDISEYRHMCIDSFTVKMHALPANEKERIPREEA